MAYLQNRVMPEGRGDRFGVLSKDEDTGSTLMAYCWVDRERRYFISTCSSLAPGPQCIRKRWRQIDTTPNAPPEFVEVVVPQPAACAIYYGACGKIDQHNKLRQSSLMLETKLKTTVWSRRVNMSLLGMMIVDSFLLAQGCQGVRRWGTASDFFVALSEQLIDNKYDQRALRKRQARAMASGHGAHEGGASGVLEASKQLCAPTPTKRPKKCNPKHKAQGKCMTCKALSCHVCRLCQRNQPDPWKKQYWICQKSGMECMGAHILKEHHDRVLLEEDEAFETGVI